MNRQDFGKWGIELKSEEFAGALAFFLRELYVRTPPDILAKLIGAREILPASDENENNLPIRLCFDSTFHFELFRRSSPAVEYYRQWRDFVDNARKRHQELEEERYENSNGRLHPRRFYLRLELYTNPENAAWLSEQFSLISDSDISVYLRTDEPGAEVGWNWALRVGFLNDPASQRLREELERYFDRQRTWLGPLVEIVNLDSENDNCDLLLIPENLRSALNIALALNIKISADCILIIGQTAEDPENIPSLIDTLRRCINTAGVGIAAVPREKRMDWFAVLIRELSHNEPIDVALFVACRRTDAPVPFLVASRQLIEFSRLVESIKSLGGKLKNYVAEKTFDVDKIDARNFGIEPGIYTGKELGEKIIHRSDDFLIDQEITSATSAVKIDGEVRKEMSAAENFRENQTRWIQAQVYDVSSESERVRLRRALRAGAPHETVVRIGADSADWERSSEEFRFERLPPGKESYKLTVVLTEPQVLDEPQVAFVTLPPEGDSTECRFFFYVGEGIKKIEARISILYKNRVLQTALLKADALPEPLEAAAENFRIEITREAVVRADFSGLKERRNFDAAFILNRDVNNEPKVTAIKDRYVSFSTPEGLEEFNKQVDRFLTAVADEPGNFAGQLNTPATVMLLSNLAEHGYNLFASLGENQYETSPLTLKKIIAGISENSGAANPKRIQIISAKPDTRLPFEFLYDRPPPRTDKAPLCPQVVAGLDQGECFSDCPGKKTPENYVCPLGFWGLSRIIERHTHSTMYSPETVRGEFRFQAETLGNRRHLNIFKKVLFAASNKADVLEEKSVEGKTELKKGGVDKIISALENITQTDVTKIVSWDDWCKKIESDVPSALILLTHTQTTRSGLPALEIEDGSLETMVLKSSSIDAKHVCFPEGGMPPVVLLIGCETGKAKVDFSSFVAKFRQRGAAIIVSTGTTIRGRHAIPVTEQLLNSLNEFTKKPDLSFGEVMRVVKQKMLARGFPMALTLMTYGDADWQIGTPQK